MKLIYPHITFLYKKLNKIIFCLTFIFFCHKNLNAQQFNNWIFLNYNGITFNTTPPSFLAGGQISNTLGGYSTASISDNDGRLLFYSDGERVWSKNNQLMPNGFGLSGRQGQINTALIIPFLNDTSKYYLFTSKGLSNFTNRPDTCKYNYSIIDMQLNGGLGDVVNKNTFIQFFATEKMVAIPNANGNDVWWICRDWTNHFFSYKINCSGFQNANPVVSTVGKNINNNQILLTTGDIKASPDGKYVAACYSQYFEIYQFNNVTGILSNPILIPMNISGGVECYGVEFSPNSKFVYITGFANAGGLPIGVLNQYNLSNYDSTAISNTVYSVSNARIYTRGGLQLGPDNKIYHNSGNKNVDVINNPNIQSAGCNLQDSVIVLPNFAYRRFPYSYINLITAQNVQISYTVASDCRTVTFTGKTYIKGNNLTFKWKWGEPAPVAGTPLDSATQVVASMGDTTYTTITHTYPPGQDTFYVNLAVTSDTLCGTGRAGTRVVLTPASPKPTANFGFTTACNNLTVAFTDSSLLNTNPTINYQYAFKPALAPPAAYTNYSTQPNHSFTFAAYDSFDVRLIVKGTSTGCAPADTIVKRIVLKAKPVAACNAITSCGSLQVSFSSTATIAAGTITQQEYYLGNTLIGTGTSFVYNFAAYGSYTIKQVVKSSLNCISDTALKTVVVENYPVASFTAANNCVGTTVTIVNNSTPNNPTVNYLWTTSDGQTSTAVLPNFSFATGGTKTIQLKLSSPTGACFSTTSQTITVDAKPVAAFDIVEACLGRNLIISNNSTGTITSYTWQTSDAQQSSSVVPAFVFNTPGNYSIKLNITTPNNCKDSITKVTPIQPVQLVVRPAVDTNVNVNQPLQLSISGAATYTWQPFTNFNNAAISNPVFKTAVPGIYPISVQATTAQGCKASASLTIKVFDAGNYLFIPNAFTPDGNGLNDKFNFTCAGLQSLSFFRVYNRYGQIVYQKSTCGNNGWDGSFKGKAQPGGAYVYNWQGVAFNGQTVSGQGTVVLVR